MNRAPRTRTLSDGILLSLRRRYCNDVYSSVVIYGGRGFCDALSRWLQRLDQITRESFSNAVHKSSKQRHE
jgi:hypothetical protein